MAVSSRPGNVQQLINSGETLFFFLADRCTALALSFEVGYRDRNQAKWLIGPRPRCAAGDRIMALRGLWTLLKRNRYFVLA
jgi:hypothetical protein